jgi:hypothetical protein
MAGFFEDIGEFFTGDKQKAAEAEQKAAQEQAAAQSKLGEERAARGEAGVNTAVADLGKVNKDIAATEAANKTDTARQQARAAQLNQQAGGYDAAAQESIGGSAADYMGKADAAAQGQASRAGQAASIAAAKNSLRAARSSGLNRGLSALRGGQTAGDVYSNVYQGGLESGRNQYMNSAQQIAGRGDAMAGRANTAEGMGQNYRTMQMQGQNQRGGNVQAQGQLGSGTMSAGINQGTNALGMSGGMATGLYGQGRQEGAAGGAGAGGALNALGSLIQSDENTKENIIYLILKKAEVPEKNGSKIDEILAKLDAPMASGLEEVRGMAKEFNYKPGNPAGEDPAKTYKGAMAQDIENTSMADNVVDTPNGKMVDSGKQTMSNLALASETVDELAELRGVIADMARELSKLKRGA